MKAHFRTTFVVVFVILTFVVSLITPFTVLADGTSTPASTTTAPATANTPAPTQASSTSAPSTQAPVATDTSAPTTQATAATDTPVPATTAAPTNVAQESTTTTDTPAPATTVAPTTTTNTPVPATTAAPTDISPLATSTATATATALAQVPSGTQIVAVDNSGAVQPLATQAAANIVATGDPIWCPAGSSPVAGSGGCTSSYSNLYNLVTYLSSNQPTSNGTIWITSGADSSTSNISMNGGSLTTWANYALTFQGGWNGSSAGTITGTSDFTNTYIYISGWKNDLTANDLTFNSSAGNNLDLETTGNIRIHHVTSKNAYNDGVYLNNTSGTGKSITVDGTNNFSNNINGNGIEAYSNSSITLNDVTANGNHLNGAILGNQGTSSNNVTLTGTNEFNANGGSGLTIYASGAVALNNINASDNTGGNGLYLDNTFYTSGLGATLTGTNTFTGNHGTNIAMWSTGDMTINNLTASNSVTGDGAYLDTTHATSGAPSVTLTGTNAFNQNNGNGLWVVAKGAISVSNATADNSKIGDGAYLDNTSGSGGISIDNGTLSDNGVTTTARGLIAHSNGNITLTGVIASNNGGGGAELDNTTGSGSITLSGTNTFNGNGFNLSPSVGLYAISNGSVTLNGVTASGNGYGFGGGAFLGTGAGGLSITNGVFSENCTNCQLGFGFVALSMGSGNTTLQGVTADNNGNDPANGYTGSTAAIGALILHNGGNVFVANSDFSGNCALGDCSGGGIEVLDFGTGGTVSFDHVTANGNGTAGSGGGAFIASNGNVDINCSTFNNNSGTGLLADIPSGSTITLNGVTLNGNTVSATNITGGGTLVTTNTGNCASTSKGTVGGGLPLNVINVNGGESNALDCTNFSGTELVLPNQDYVLLPCPTTGNASLTGKANNNLPGKLDGKYTFVSAFDVEVVPSSNGSLIVSFKIPSGQENANFTILHWDGSKWVSLSGFKTSDGFFQAQTNLTGNFVFVTQ